MIKRLFQRIDPADAEVLRKYTSSFPVALGALARELGISIKISALGTGTSGKISVEGNQYVIRVNRNESRERQRFTIGHELAHYLLHRDLIDGHPDGIRDNVLYRSGAPEKVEYEANRLGAEIVMPADLVRSNLEAAFSGIVTDDTIEQIAESFEVSRAAMEIRLSSL